MKPSSPARILRRMLERVQPPISARTRYCAVYGHPIQHSASPAMQNAGITALGLDWRYLAFDVHPSNLRAAIDGAKAMRFVGLNLTVPHKLLALDMVDLLDHSAMTWGAVNTVRFEARCSGPDWLPIHQCDPEAIEEVRTRGFNTDADAIVQSLREDLNFNPADASVLVLGAGGAGRVAALKLAAEKVQVLHLVNRTSDKAKRVAREIQERFPEVKVRIGYPTASVDLLLNATSLGLKPSDPSPLDAAEFQLERAAMVYDMIYRPAETKLLQSARTAGCRVANGLGMLLYQGAKALELWSGQTPPVPVMRHALAEHIYGPGHA